VTSLKTEVSGEVSIVYIQLTGPPRPKKHEGRSNLLLSLRMACESDVWAWAYIKYKFISIYSIHFEHFYRHVQPIKGMKVLIKEPTLYPPNTTYITTQKDQIYLRSRYIVAAQLDESL